MGTNRTGARIPGMLIGAGAVQIVVAAAGWIVVMVNANVASRRGAAIVLLAVAVVIGGWLVVELLRLRGRSSQAEPLAEPEPIARAPVVQPPVRETRGFLDDLTALPARPWFEHTFRSEIARSARYHRPLSLVVIDVDQFARLNQEHGRANGDYVLLTIADIFRTSVRQSDQIARIEDDEFAIVVPETDSDGAEKVGEKIRRAIELYPFDEGLEITVSVGVATVTGGDTAESLLLRGEAAVMTARQRGGNACATAQT